MSTTYATSLDTIRNCITQRSSRYRSLVILVSLSAILFTGTAILLGRADVLLAFTLLPTIIGIYIAIDLQIVEDWRTDLLRNWSRGRVQLDIYSITARRFPNLPASTLDGMLNSLPAFATVNIPMAVRQQLVRVQATVTRFALVSIVARSIVWGAAALAGIAAWLCRDPAWLLWWSVLVLLSMGWRIFAVRSLSDVRAAVCHEWHEAGIATALTVAWLDAISVHGLPPYLVAAWQNMRRAPS